MLAVPWHMIVSPEAVDHPEKDAQGQVRASGFAFRGLALPPFGSFIMFHPPWVKFSSAPLVFERCGGKLTLSSSVIYPCFISRTYILFFVPRRLAHPPTAPHQ